MRWVQGEKGGKGRMERVAKEQGVVEMEDIK